MKLSIIFGFVFATVVAADFVKLNPEFDLEVLSKTSKFDTRSSLESLLEGAIKLAIEKIAKSDPVEIPNIDINNKTFKLKLENVKLAGFGKLQLTSIKIGEDNSTLLNFMLPSLSAGASNYDLKGIILLPVFGNGLINLKITGITAALGATLNLEKISVSNITIDMTVKKTNLQLTGVYNNKKLSQIISAAVTECLPVQIKNFGKRISELFSKYLEQLINELLNPKSASAISLPQFEKEIIRSMTEQIITMVIQNVEEKSVKLTGA